MNLFSAAERIAAADHSEVVFDPARCLRAGDQFSTCESCFEICPVAAILPCEGGQSEGPKFAAEQCAGCLACLPACPVGAYSADDEVHALVNCAARIEERTVELVCGKNQQGGAGSSAAPAGSAAPVAPAAPVALRLQGCLAGLGPGAYLALAALGLERVTVRLDACPTCAWGSLLPEIEARLAAARRLLAGRGRGEVLAWVSDGTPVGGRGPAPDRPVWDVHNPPLSRRDLFRLANRQGQLSLARAMTGERGGGGQRPPRERNRVVDALAHLPVQVGGDAGASLAGLGYAWLAVSEACTACEACVRACPTGALRFTAGGEHFELHFVPTACVGCEKCVHACAAGAITLDPGPSFGQVFDRPEPYLLQSGALARCARCNVTFAARAGVKYCPLCDWRRRHPFGSPPPTRVEQTRVEPVETRIPARSENSVETQNLSQSESGLDKLDQRDYRP